LAYALTIHKSKGQTISKAVIEIGRVEKSLGMSFVAFSRVKNYKDYLVEPFSLERFLKIKESSTLQARNVEENRINNIVDETLTRFNYLLNFRNEKFLFYFFIPYYIHLNLFRVINCQRKVGLY
jgi:hypothetical protein